MIMHDKTAEAEHISAFRDEIVRRGDRGPSTAQLLVQSGERCFCGGVCKEILVACLDCEQKWGVVPSHVKAFEQAHNGHAVTITHTAPRSTMGAIIHS